VKSWVPEVGRSSMVFEQVASPAGAPKTISSRARVKAVWIGEDGRPARIPAEVRTALGAPA
jgi:acyl-CoA thioesterase FadM